MSANFKRKRTSQLSESDIDYKNIPLLKEYINEVGKIVPRRITGASTSVQRELARAVKQARFIGLLPYCDNHK